MENNFYVLQQKTLDYYAQAIQTTIKKTDYETTICKLCGGRKIKMISDLAVYFKGKRQADLYWVPQHMIISEKIQKILEEVNATGYKLKDINSLGWYDGKERNMEVDTLKLKELIVTGKTGYVRDIDGIILEKCTKCGRRTWSPGYKTQGLSIDINEWDKSDIFYFKNLSIPIVTERVKNAIEKEKLKNVIFQNIKEYILI